MSKSDRKHELGKALDNTVQKQLRRAARLPEERKLRQELMRMRTGIWRFEVARWKRG